MCSINTGPKYEKAMSRTSEWMCFGHDNGRITDPAWHANVTGVYDVMSRIRDGTRQAGADHD